MDKFLEWCNPPRLNWEEVENMNRPIISTKIKSVIKKLPTIKSSGPDGFTGEFYQTVREKLMPTCLKLFQKVSEEGTLLNLFYETTTTLIPKPEKIPQKKKTTGQYH